MTVHLCDRCGDVVLVEGTCRCSTPCDLIEVRRRHRRAVGRARDTDALIARPAETRRAA